MKKIIILLIFCISLPLLAEEGELQMFLGTGAYIPFKQYTQDKTVYIYATYNIPISLNFGITDNLDIGIYGSYSKLYNTNINTKYKNLKGVEYFDYRHININIQTRYNILPGFLFFAPHILLGVGNNIETYYNRAFYLNDNKKIYKDYKAENNTTGNINLQAGIDITSNFWWFFLAKGEIILDYTLNGNKFMECNIYLGIRWMSKTYGGR